MLSGLASDSSLLPTPRRGETLAGSSFGVTANCWTAGEFCPRDCDCCVLLRRLPGILLDNRRLMASVLWLAASMLRMRSFSRSTGPSLETRRRSPRLTLSSLLPADEVDLSSLGLRSFLRFISRETLARRVSLPALPSAVSMVEYGRRERDATVS